MAVQQLVTVASVSVDRNSRASAKSAWMISGLKEKKKIYIKYMWYVVPGTK